MCCMETAVKVTGCQSRALMGRQTGGFQVNEIYNEGGMCFLILYYFFHMLALWVLH